MGRPDAKPYFWLFIGVLISSIIILHAVPLIYYYFVVRPKEEKCRLDPQADGCVVDPEHLGRLKKYIFWLYDFPRAVPSENQK